MDIDDWRERIDVVDLRILELLNERTRCSLEIGRLKRARSMPVYAPEREKGILERLTRLNSGPLTNAAIRRLFERIIDESRRLEKEGYESSGNHPTAA